MLNFGCGVDKLKASTPSRIVNVSSLAAKYSTRLSADNLNEHPEGGEVMAENYTYSKTKLCNVLFANELAKKLDGSGVTANSLHPGGVQTELWRTTYGFIGVIFKTFTDLFCKSAEDGAQTTIYVALSKDIEGISGEFFENCRQISMYESATDVTLAKNVWKKSEQLVKLTNAEKL